MSFTATLMDGIAQYLENSDVGIFNSSGVPYSASQVGIFIDSVPASPDKVIVLNPYDETDHPVLSDSELFLQARVRGDRDPRTAYAINDAVFDALQNLGRRPIGGTTVVGAWRLNTGYMGVDSNGRHERTSNWRLLIHRPSPNRV